MKTIPILAFAFALLLCVTGCSRGGDLLVTRADFDKVTDSIFDADHFDQKGGGLSGWENGAEFTVVYVPKDPEAELRFDFSAWDSFLRAKDTFSGYEKGGSQGLYWQQTWENRNRFILLDAVLMKDGSLRVTYYEVLR